MRPYFVEQGSDDADVGWLRLACIVLGIVLLVMAWAWVSEVRRPLLHVDLTRILETPPETWVDAAPDIRNATGMAYEAAERWARFRPSTIAEDQAWLVNRMTAELARAYEEDAARIIAMARQANGEVRATVRSVTPVNDRPPFRVEVVVSQEFVGDLKAPGRGKADPRDPTREEYRYVFTLVRTEKSMRNRDALLIRSVTMATTR